MTTFRIGDTVKILPASNSWYKNKTGTVTDTRRGEVEVSITGKEMRLWFKNRHVEPSEEKVIGFEVGKPCHRCRKGVFEKRVGAVVCSYCGRIEYLFNAVAFDSLDVGDKFKSAGERESEAKVWVKGAGTKPDRHSNAHRLDRPDLNGQFNGKVVLQ